MFPRVPRRLAFGLPLCALGCVIAGLSLVAPHDRVQADDGSDDRVGRRAEWAHEKTTTVDMGGGMKMEFVLILPGTFRMGSPPEEQGHTAAEKQHVVRITRPFYLAKYPTTQEQYEAITGTNPSHFSAKGGGKDRVAGLDTRRFPVESITWNAATAYCARVTKNDARRRTFRLPTEAEWEYACRAGTTTPYHFGSELNGKQANCHGQVPYGTDQKGPSLRRTTKVGSYPPNAWGLYDMHGNVYQWCADYYGPYDRLPAQDPLQRKPQGNDVHVLRCGSWDLHATYCRAAYRDYLGPDAVNASVGFRVAFHPE